MIDVINKTGKYSATCKCTRCSEEYDVKNTYDANKSLVGELCTKCKTAITAMKNPTQESLLAVFSYDSATGEVSHKFTTKSGKQGDTATHKFQHGYRGMTIGAKTYLAHRVIFMMKEGYWPEYIDHINHSKGDNRWCNLREVTHGENSRNVPVQANSSTGNVGVSMDKRTGRYRAYISVNSKYKHLGVFDTIEEAVDARKKADIQYEYHPNHGKVRSGVTSWLTIVGSSPNNMNHVRHHYANIVADLADSNILQDILREITGDEVVVQKLSNNLGDIIREADYMLS